MNSWSKEELIAEVNRLRSRLLELGEPPSQATKPLTELDQDVANPIAFDESKLESLGLLAGGIAHDFNNILVGVIGFADIAYNILPENEPAREYISKALTSARSASELVRQLLIYSGKGNYAPKTVDLNVLLKQSRDMLQASISKTSTLKCNYDSSPVTVKGDPSQLHQVIMNLGQNGSEAMGDNGGVVSVSVGSMHCSDDYIARAKFRPAGKAVSPVKSGDYCFIEVSDTGAGISEDHMGRIFEPFYTTREQSRGLGLSATQGIAVGHNGFIKVSSQQNQGTTVKFLLPQLSEVSTDTSESAQQPLDQELPSGTFLVADDEESVRAVSKHILERLGFKVITAKDGAEAVEMFEQHQNEIICTLLDMTMPRMDGAAAFHEIRTLDSTAKVILMSGYNEQDATQLFSGKGLTGFLQKPYRINDLVEKVKSAFGHNGR